MQSAQFLIPSLLVLCALSLLGMTAALLAPVQTEQPNFTPPPFEENAHSGTPQVPDGLGWSELDAQAYKASVCGKAVVENGQMQIFLTNPQTNEVWLKLRVMDEDGNVLGETGLIKPGEYVQAVQLSETPPQGSVVRLKLMGYEPETYYSAGAVTLNTTIP